MSKDKSHKKDKSKKHDLFSLMLEQSEVFRDMVAHFQSAWTPKVFVRSSVVAADTAPAPEAVIAKKPTRVARPAKKPVTKKVAPVKKAVVAPAAKKPVIATKKKSAKKASSAKNPAPVVTKKSAVKTARRPAKKGSPRK